MSDESAPATAPPDVVLAQLVRSGVVESVHRGSIVAVGPDGAVRWSAGAVDVPVFPRSCNKPLQAVGMLREGLSLDGPLLALACASHSGEAFHLAGAREILAGAGLGEDALQTPPDLPVEEAVRLAYVRAGGRPAPVAMNCSGKHAAMLATCVARGWPTDTYREPEHPLQRAIAATFAELTGQPVAAVAVDGCGAPLLACTLTGLARAFSRVQQGPAGSAERRVADAVAAYPEQVSGTTRDEAALLRAFPGAIAKAGAESCYALAMPDGTGVALKVSDGSPRARPVVMASALRRLGYDHPVLVAQASAPVLGGGRQVGELRGVLA